MHELSLAMEVIELVRREAEKQGVSKILEIDIEVGDLSGIEAEAFQFGMEMQVKGTILDGATINLVQTPGTGICSGCQLKFEMKNRLDACPKCKCFPSEITGGQEFRVLSLIAE